MIFSARFSDDDDDDVVGPLHGYGVHTGRLTAHIALIRGSPSTRDTANVKEIRGGPGRPNGTWEKRGGTHLSECCKRPGKSSFRRVQRLPFTTLSLNALARPAEATILPGARAPASGAASRADSNRGLARFSKVKRLRKIRGN